MLSSQHYGHVFLGQFLLMTLPPFTHPVWTPGKQKQEQPLGEVLEELRAKLKWTQGELEAQREAERQRQVQVRVQGNGRRGSGCPVQPCTRLPQEPKSYPFP